MCKNLYHFFLIKRSGLFDQAYYLFNNPDVRKADMDPLWHFIKFGWKEERNPSKILDIHSFCAKLNGQITEKNGPLITLFYKRKFANINDKTNTKPPSNDQEVSPETILNNFNDLQREYINQSNIREKLILSIQLASRKPKVFCIGLNKTGTTSMAKAFYDLGLIVGDQRLAELLLDDWATRDFRSLYNYCLTAQAFQDIPFSLPYSYQALDSYFPESKFILTMREDSEQWYNSLIQFHSKFFGKDKTPTITDLKEADYVYPGYIYKTFKWIYNTSEEDPYNHEVLLRQYETYNFTVQDYFKLRPNDLLVLKLSDPESYQKLCNFLERPYNGEKFPHENKTVDF